MSWQDWFWMLLADDWSVADIADGYGLSERRVWSVLGVPATTEVPKAKPASVLPPASVDAHLWGLAA